MAAAIFAIRRKKREKAAAALQEGGEGIEGVTVEERPPAPVIKPQSLSPPPPTPSTIPGGPPVLHLPHQDRVYKVYTNSYVQGSVAAIIVANFVVTICQKEFDPYPEHLQVYAERWRNLDLAFNVVFTIELAVNIYGSFFYFFWKNPWNVFDFIVVLVSLLAQGGALTGGLKDLKILRAFRVFRLFKRVPSLNKIVTALVRSIPGVLNAFVIMLIVMCIYAIIAVEYFKTFGGDGTYVTQSTYGTGTDLSYVSQTVSSLSPRLMRHGEEYYGTFSRALYTLFQVLTGESWAEAVARPLIFGYDPSNAVFPTIFYVSFILIVQIVLVNVVVAVLLDKFVDEEPQKEDPNATAEAEANEEKKVTLHEEIAGLRSDLKKVKDQLDGVDDLKSRLEGLVDHVVETLGQHAVRPALSA